jgi:hypothetical protein
MGASSFWSSGSTASVNPTLTVETQRAVCWPEVVLGLQNFRHEVWNAKPMYETVVRNEICSLRDKI